MIRTKLALPMETALSAEDSEIKAFGVFAPGAFLFSAADLAFSLRTIGGFRKLHIKSA